MRIEQFDQLGEVGQRPRQTVDLVDDDDVENPFRSASKSLTMER